MLFMGVLFDGGRIVFLEIFGLCGLDDRIIFIGWFHALLLTPDEWLSPGAECSVGWPCLLLGGQGLFELPELLHTDPTIGGISLTSLLLVFLRHQGQAGLLRRQ